MKLLDLFKKNKGFLAGILILMAMRWCFADQYRVPSGSMEPSIHIGDHIAVNKAAYNLKVPFIENMFMKTGEPQRGDVVVFIWPVDNSTIFVKRLIGIPGDHIQVHNGFITINGEPLKGSDEGERGLQAQTNQTFHYQETLADHQYNVQRLPEWAHANDLDITVPADSYFFMGDNRDNSEDSRYWGFVKRENLKGKAERILWNITFTKLVPAMDFQRILHKLD